MKLETRLKLNKPLTDMEQSEVWQLLSHKMQLNIYNKDLLYEIRDMYGALKKVNHPAYIGKIGEFLQ